METDKSLQKLRRSLHEALSKLQMVSNTLHLSFESTPSFHLTLLGVLAVILTLRHLNQLD